MLSLNKPGPGRVIRLEGAPSNYQGCARRKFHGGGPKPATSQQLIPEAPAFTASGFAFSPCRSEAWRIRRTIDDHRAHHEPYGGRRQSSSFRAKHHRRTVPRPAAGLFFQARAGTISPQRPGSVFSSSVNPGGRLRTRSVRFFERVHLPPQQKPPTRKPLNARIVRTESAAILRRSRAVLY
jgi:hypothetical protein